MKNKFITFFLARKKMRVEKKQLKENILRYKQKTKNNKYHGHLWNSNVFN